MTLDAEIYDESHQIECWESYHTVDESISEEETHRYVMKFNPLIR